MIMWVSAREQQRDEWRAQKRASRKSPRAWPALTSNMPTQSLPHSAATPAHTGTGRNASMVALQTVVVGDAKERLSHVRIALV